MRSLLTGYAGAFNRRHARVGHLFQNRFKSIVCEEEAYLLELVRYIHLNPLRGGLVQDLTALDGYPYTGHSALMGTVARPWQEKREVLARFSSEPRSAKAEYRRFVRQGVKLGRRSELTGGGLVRSAGGWDAVKELRRGREAFSADERILGSSEFVGGTLKQLQSIATEARSTDPSFDLLVTKVCKETGLTREALTSGSRFREHIRARDGLAYLWIECLGRSGRELARQINIRPESTCRAGRRGRDESERWRRLLS
jgi:hypothetical protein